MTTAWVMLKTIKELQDFVNIVSNYGCRMELVRENKSYYEVRIITNQNFNKSMIYLNMLDEEYKKIVQTETYQNIMKKVKESSDMEVENEYLEEDSVVLVVKCIENRA